MTRLGQNIYFPIYKDVDGVRTPFENLVLKKSVFDSTLMSLSDNISGSVYYKDNSLDVSLHEYIIYKNVKYVLVNPPTIVREGLVSDNSDAKGMTKYSFVFYHPMYQLSNMPFTDVAVSFDELKYKSEDKKFSWIGNLHDFINKINKNLSNTEWIVSLSVRVPRDVASKLSDVLSFDSVTIADALKQLYETWEVPYVVDAISDTEADYLLGKRFRIVIGLPSNEIYASPEDEQIDNPFVFKFGKGVGLKNNSATPRNNKIITRIAGYGSEDNVPFGYPQIVWQGNPLWEYTINNDSTNPFSYPIYDGIVGGQKVRLIKHPFTRSYLMPTIYADRVNKKVNPYVRDYDPSTELIDYYDANDPSIYPNTIVASAPSYEVHQFEDIKPELGTQYIISATPLNADLTPASGWDDTMDEDGNYAQSYFKVKLPVLSFDLYACASITQEMEINMRDGACIGCTFPVQVDWDDYKVNFFDSDGNFAPYGSQRDYNKYPRSDQQQIEIILQKEYQTFGVIMPNVYQNPTSGDQFVILGISLPLSYITDAQTRLDDAMKSYMLENNVHYFDYPLKFDEKFLYDNTYILEQIRNNTIIRFQDPTNRENNIELYVKQISIKYGEGVLPQYDITLTDDVSVVLNQIGQAQEDISKINTLISELRQNYNRNIWSEIARKLSKVKDDTAQGKITFNKGLHSNEDATFGKWASDASGAGIWKDEKDNWHIAGDYLHARKKLVAKEVQIEDVHHVGGQQLLTAASMTADFVVDKCGVYRCFFRRIGDDGKEVYNKWRVNDQAYVCTFNLKVQDNHTGGDGDKVGNHYLWRLVTATSNETSDTGTYVVGGEMVDASKYHFIDLSKTICDSMSDAPLAGDDIVQLGHQGDDLGRQNAIILAGAGTESPYIREFTHITTFHLPAPETQLKPGDNLLSGIVKMTAGSQLPDGSDVSNTIGGLVSGQEALREDVDTLDTGNENLLRNTGFTGDYESDEVQGTTEVDGDTEMWSPRLKYWEGSNVEPVTDVRSTTGMAATLTQGILKQSVSSIEYGEPMCISVKCFGTAIAISFGGYSEAITPTDNARRYIIKMNVYDASQTDFVIQGTGTVMEVMLTRGKIPNADWIPSPLDNDKAVSYFQNLSYLANAITNADTNILGGLILTQMIRVGNYRDGGMNGETGGMSGIYTSEQSPFLWGGGDMEQAFYTIGKYARDPSYQATEEEVRRMAKFVVTHGGRAILNDIVLRGYIYALGGYFKGEVHADKGVFNGEVNATSGIFSNILSPNGAFKITSDGYLECVDARVKGSIYNPMLVIDDTLLTQFLLDGTIVHHVPEAPSSPYFEIVNLEKTGLNIMIKWDWIYPQDTYIQLPCDQSKYDGAKAHIMNSTSATITIHGSMRNIANQFTLESGQIGVYYCIPSGGGVYVWQELVCQPQITQQS